LIALGVFYTKDVMTFNVPCKAKGNAIQKMSIIEAAIELATRIVSIFARDNKGRRAFFGDVDQFQSDPLWRDYIRFHEYFNGDNAKGLGANHQTGWTGIISMILKLMSKPKNGIYAKADIVVNSKYGLEIKYPNPADSTVTITPWWNLFLWQVCFIRLGPNVAFPCFPYGDNDKHYVKVFLGSLTNFEFGNTVTNPHHRRDLSIPRGMTFVSSGPDGAIFAYFIASGESMNTTITDMKSGAIQNISGPHSEALQWKYYGDLDPKFKDVDFYNLRGFRFTDFDGTRLGYVQFWTIANGADAGYHDHSGETKDTTFCEIHFDMYNGTGHGGMQFQMTEYPNLNLFVPMPPGFEHGPFWYFDYKTGLTLLDEKLLNVKYPMHRWISGGEKGVGTKSYDVWVAFEMLHEECTVPNYFLTSLIPDRESIIHPVPAPPPSGVVTSNSQTQHSHLHLN